MKVERPGRAGIQGLTRGKKKAGPDAKFSLGATRAEVPTPSVSGLGPVTMVDALLAVQESGGRGQNRQARGQKSATEMLDLLQKVQSGLLLGEIAGADLHRLKTVMAERRKQENDPQLTQILEDIEVRASVELAKLGYGV